MHKLILTFDIEDFINPNAVSALRAVLELLNKYRLSAIFFITGHMAEKLSNFPDILDLFKNHEIGFHSSGHSVRPTILEYTDVDSYQQAYSASLERETAHINPVTGKAEGKGGIYLLQNLFSQKRIKAYRAPGMSWTPPHLEALADLGIKFDFSSSIAASEPVHYRKIIFYPYTFIQQWDNSLFDYRILLYAILKSKVSVFDLHPTLYVNRRMWDSIYHKGNPHALKRIPARPLKEVTSLFVGFELLLQKIRLLDNTKLIEVNPHLTVSTRDLIVSKSDVQRYYETSVGWARKFFMYNPRYIRNHFQEFFVNAHC